MPILFALTATLLAIALLIGQTIIAQRDARERAAVEGDTLLAVQFVLRIMLDAETSQRGYMLTSDSEYLQPYAAAKKRLGSAIADLRRAEARADDPTSASRVELITGLASAKFEEMDRTVALTRSGLQSQAMMIINSDLGKQQMDALRTTIIDESRLRARQRRDAFERAATLERRLVPLVVILGIAVVAFVAMGFRIERNRAKAAIEAEQANALRDANARAQLLARELNHRVKNLFSVILSIVALSGRKRDQREDVVESIRARIHALSLAHAASQGVAEDATAQLGEVVVNTMKPYIDEDGQRVRIEGPAVLLPIRMVTPLGMIVHELATNAVKYGALSADDGTVDIRWEIRPEGDAGRLALAWTELGGPPPSLPEAAPGRGFGSQMIQLAVHQLGGVLTRDWPASGAVVGIEFPLPKADLQ